MGDDLKNLCRETKLFSSITGFGKYPDISL